MSTVKFYLHCKNPDITLVIKWDQTEGTVKDLHQIVQENLKRKIPNIFEKDILFKVRGKILESGNIVVRKIRNKDDVDLIIQDRGNSKTAEEQKSSEKISSQEQHQATSSNADRIAESFSIGSSLENRQLLRRAKAVYEDVLTVDPNNKIAHLRIVDCYLNAKRAKKALHLLRKLQKLQIKDIDNEIQYRLGQCYVMLGEGEKAVEVLQKYCVELRKSGGTDTKHKHQVQVLLAKAYLLINQRDMAIVILQGVVREDQMCVEALTEYAPLIYSLGATQSEEAMTVLLTLVANHRENSHIKEKFAWACKQQDGMKILERVADKAWSDIASLVFMATTIREFGAITEALSIMRHAYDLKRSDPHTLLTLVHMLEVTNDHSSAIKEILNYIDSNPEEKIGKFKCKDLSPLTTIMSSDQFDSDTPSDLQTDIEVPSDTAAIYSPDEMYLLALLHTFVKILYVNGYLWVIPHLTKALDPLTDNRDLHLTNIRNEVAYYSCISKVVKTVEHFPENTRSVNYLYFIGDSHCITPAWQSIMFKCKRHMIHPFLSTGTKIWHLRKESQFYPKINFYNVTKSIPKNSPVVLCLGEIDCREALLLCVEKLKYDTIEEAIDSVIDIYIEVILDLVSQFKWKIYIHPVMPVLDITRDLVMQFNASLKDRLSKESHMHWLDFVDNLVYNGGDGEMKLKEEYKFDGTHVHPKYTSLLERSLEKVT